MTAEKTATLLVELFTEELPPKALKRLGEAFASGIESGLRTHGFLSNGSAATSYATPRRLAVAVTRVAGQVTLPPEPKPLLPVSVAFDSAGLPTEALQKAVKSKLGFESFDRIPGERIERRSDGKVLRLFYIEPPINVTLRSELQDVLDATIAKLPIAKVMGYARPNGGYYNDIRFVRPAHRLTALHGAQVVPVNALGLEAGRTTGGHRFLSHDGIQIATAEAYEPTLAAEGKVIASFAERRAKIVAELSAAAAGATVLMPDALLDEVTALVEWPKVYTGGFDPAFLAVPQECLILTMQQNQKYFALSDASGKLQNRFLLVSNLETHDPEAIIRGNERVLRARLADAKFFFDQDRKQPLAARVPRLATVVYQTKLGSQLERVERVRAIARLVAERTGADPTLADRAGYLAKADLLTDMVGEFPELQGLMGRYYALHDGEPAAVAAAIEQHYWPRFAGDALPEGSVATSVAIADKMEALAGMFGTGNAPTGDKDPFGLRRQALGVLRILMEKALPLPLDRLVDDAFGAFSEVKAVQSAHTDLETFIYERLRAYLRDQGYTANQVEAVLCMRPARIDLIPAQMDAIRIFATLPEAEALATANKRIGNILRKSESEAAAAIDRSLLAQGAEHDLYVEIERLLPVVHRHVGRGDYTEALRALASARTSVDRFFDDVLVMADDPAIRANRLALLRGLSTAMNQVADISKLAS